ncbi:MAG: hypothetical protein KTR24_12350, partial [Saprospiraceae bacterium]|nr:hypothetical protein [Saprospiraceae bacterium]
MMYVFLFLLGTGPTAIMHEFYVSVTNVTWAKNEVSVVSRIFYEDLSIALSSGEGKWSWSNEPLTDTVLMD